MKYGSGYGRSGWVTTPTSENEIPRLTSGSGLPFHFKDKDTHLEIDGWGRASPVYYGEGSHERHYFEHGRSACGDFMLRGVYTALSATCPTGVSACLACNRAYKWRLHGQLAEERRANEEMAVHQRLEEARLERERKAEVTHLKKALCAARTARRVEFQRGVEERKQERENRATQPKLAVKKPRAASRQVPAKAGRSARSTDMITRDGLPYVTARFCVESFGFTLAGFRRLYTPAFIAGPNAADYYLLGPILDELGLQEGDL